jgi:hypothetical protein
VGPGFDEVRWTPEAEARVARAPMFPRHGPAARRSGPEPSVRVITPELMTRYNE